MDRDCDTKRVANDLQFLLNPLAPSLFLRHFGIYGFGGQMTVLQSFDITDWIGILGSFMIAGAYFGVSGGHLDGQKSPFQLVNLAGASMVLFSLWFRPNAGAIMIEALWVAIALFALAKNFLRRG